MLAIVTGATSGIGKEIANQLAMEGYDLLLISRNTDKLIKECDVLTAKYSVKVNFLTIDLSEDHIEATLDSFFSKNSEVPTIIVNNAGVGMWELAEFTNIDDAHRLLNLNLKSVITITLYFLKKMKDGDGYILNVSSTTAYQSVPTMSVYAATKSAVLSFGRSVSYELKNGRGKLSLTTVCPGPTTSNFLKASDMMILSSSASLFEMSAEKVASKSLDAMYKRKVEYIPGVINVIGCYFAKIFPSALVEHVVASLYFKKIEKKERSHQCNK